MTNLVIKRVGENRYVAYLSGCVVGRSYTMQLRLAPPVVSSWEYAGVFVAVDGTITTWEWAIPNLQYPSEFRFIDSVMGAASNVVTIDPKNPPPIDGNGVVPPSEGGFGVLPLIILAIVAFLFIVSFVGGKKK